MKMKNSILSEQEKDKIIERFCLQLQGQDKERMQFKIKDKTKMMNNKISDDYTNIVNIIKINIITY